MLTCIACSKQLNTNGSVPEPQEEEEEDDNAHTPSTKHAIKLLTVQIKDIALKASSGAYKNCKPCSSHDRDCGYAVSYMGSVSERLYGSYRRTGGSRPTTLRPNRRLAEANIMGYSSSSATPASVSSRKDSIVFMEEDEHKEWTAQVEPGVMITFVSLPNGGNDLMRIRFSREIFNKWQAQKWWADNYDKVIELYNVRRFDQKEAPLRNPSQSEDVDSTHESGEVSPMTPSMSKERSSPRRFHRSPGTNRAMPPQHQHPSRRNSTSKGFDESSSMDASARSSDSSRERDRSEELSMAENEWVEQDEPGVYVTVRALNNGGRELRRVRFSRDVFGETQARVWWEENKERIRKQYL